MNSAQKYLVERPGVHPFLRRVREESLLLEAYDVRVVLNPLGSLISIYLLSKDNMALGRHEEQYTLQLNLASIKEMGWRAASLVEEGFRFCRILERWFTDVRDSVNDSYFCNSLTHIASKELGVGDSGYFNHNVDFPISPSCVELIEYNLGLLEGMLVNDLRYTRLVGVEVLGYAVAFYMTRHPFIKGAEESDEKEV
jgi:hypothetical protein